MQILSKDQSGKWCNQHQIALNDRGLPGRADFAAKFEIPGDAGRRVYLVSRCMAEFRTESQILVWFDDWSVWPSGQRMHIFDQFRKSYGEERWLIQSPGHVFDQVEIEDAISFVTLAVLFLWDCYIVTPKRTKFLYFSHDEYGLAKGLNLDVK